MLSNTVAPALTLDERLLNIQRLKKIIAEADAQLTVEVSTAKDDMARQGLDSYTVGDSVFVLTPKDGKKTLDKAELVALGVSTETIAKATKTGKEYLQLDVRKVK